MTATMTRIMARNATASQGRGSHSKAFGIWLTPRGPLVAQSSFLKISRRISAMPIVAIAR